MTDHIVHPGLCQVCSAIITGRHTVNCCAKCNVTAADRRRRGFPVDNKGYLHALHMRGKKPRRLSYVGLKDELARKYHLTADETFGLIAKISSWLQAEERGEE